MTEIPQPDAIDHVDLSRNPGIQMVQDTGDDLDLDDAVPFEELPTAQNSIQSRPAAKAPQTARDIKRRTRGMSLLPVRQANEPSRASPPHTPSPLKQLGKRESLTPGSPPSGAGSNRLMNSTASMSSNVSSANNTPTPSGSAIASSTFVDNDQLLSTYISQLAAKEARVGDLRATISSLQEELRDAEAKLTSFKDNGKKLAEIVHGNSHGGLEHGNSNRLPARRTSSSEGQNDVLGIGKRVVDEIGTQFWSFLEDVKSATMGNADFEQLRDEQRHKLTSSPILRPEGAAPSPKPASPVISDTPPPLPPRSSSRSPSPARRQLSPKRSIQNFMRSRSPSPVRNPLSPSRSLNRQELAEHHASQRLRESQRLTKKLSHIDLRAPTNPQGQ